MKLCRNSLVLVASMAVILCAASIADARTDTKPAPAPDRRPLERGAQIRISRRAARRTPPITSGRKLARPATRTCTTATRRLRTGRHERHARRPLEARLRRMPWSRSGARRRRRRHHEDLHVQESLREGNQRPLPDVPCRRAPAHERHQFRAHGKWRQLHFLPLAASRRDRANPCWSRLNPSFALPATSSRKRNSPCPSTTASRRA